MRKSAHQWLPLHDIAAPESEMNAVGWMSYGTDDAMPASAPPIEWPPNAM